MIPVEVEREIVREQDEKREGRMRARLNFFDFHGHF